MADLVMVRAHHLKALRDYLTDDRQLFYNVNRTDYGTKVADFLMDSFGKIEKGEADVMIVSSLDDICRVCCCPDAECRVPDEGPDAVVMKRIGLEPHKAYNGQEVCKRLMEAYGGLQ
ncbi:MAG: hypothetical protein WC852_06230 [Candidatus Nanoarchaeia archaeon]|jgi:hypothetical protein